VRSALILAMALALALAGCADGPPPAAPPPEAAPTPVPVAEAVDWQATVAPSQCINGPVLYTCGAVIFLFGAEAAPTYLHDAKDRSLAGGNLTLSWTPLTPTTNALKATAYVLEDCDDSCAVNRTLASDAGESPLLLGFGARELAEGQFVAVRVEPLPLAPNLRVTLQQDVHLTGTLAFAGDALPAPDEDDEDEED
jgi:hypothetical protein